MTGHAAVQGIEEFADGLVEFGEREEAAIAEPGEDPAFDDLDGDLDLGFVAGRASRAPFF